MWIAYNFITICYNTIMIIVIMMMLISYTPCQVLFIMLFEGTNKRIVNDRCVIIDLIEHIITAIYIFVYYKTFIDLTNQLQIPHYRKLSKLG